MALEFGVNKVWQRVKNNVTVMDERYWNALFEFFDRRFSALEGLAISWQAAVAEVTQFGLARIEQVLGPAFAVVTKAAELGFLVAASSTPAELAVGVEKSLYIDEDVAGIFTPSAFVEISKSDGSGYALAAVVSYTKQTGELRIEPTFLKDLSGEHDDWVISASAALWSRYGASLAEVLEALDEINTNGAVTSVNGQGGAVTLTAADLGAATADDIDDALAAEVTARNSAISAAVAAEATLRSNADAAEVTARNAAISAMTLIRGLVGVTGAYNVAAADLRKLISLGGSTNYTLGTDAAASTLGANFSFGVENVGSAVVTFDPNGSETILTRAGALSSLRIYPGESFTLAWDGTNWRALGREYGLVRLSSATVGSTVSSVEYTNHFDDPELRAILVRGRNIVTANPGTPSVQVKKGGALVSAANQYWYGYNSSSGEASPTTHTSFQLLPTSNSGTLYLDIEFDGIQESAVAQQFIKWQSTREALWTMGQGRCVTTGAIQGFALSVVSMTSGDFTFYGRRS